MGKKVSLQDLANASKITESNNTVATPTESANVGNMSEVSIADIKKTLPEKEKEEFTPLDEVIDTAVKDMVKTMEGKKQKFDEVVRPQLEELKRDMEIEEELNSVEESEESDDIDEFDDIINNADVEDEEVSNEEDDIAVEEEQPVVTPVIKKQEQVVEEDEEKEEVKVKEAPPVAKTTTKNFDLDEHGGDSIGDEIEDIDKLLGDLEEDTSSDFDDIELGSEEEETTDEIKERLKKQTVRLRSTNTVDRSDFKIRKKPISSSSLLTRLGNKSFSKTADWALLGTGKSYTFSEASGPELESLQKTIANSNSLNAVIASLKLIYNHIVDANKPGFEAWCKTTKYEDLESLYFGLYKACYGDVNLIGRTCEKDEDDKNDMHCGKTSVIDTPINDMCKFKSDEAREKFNKILEHDTTSSSNTIESTIIDISDSIAIGYTEPTLYTTLIQFSSMNENLIRKHETMLNTMAYIDSFYFIDEETKEYIPIEYKIYPNNLNKTIISKLKLYVQICKLITSDQYDTMVAKIAANLDKESEIEYVLPETTCPECGATIKEEPAGSMLELLFMHRQLTAIANS